MWNEDGDEVVEGEDDEDGEGGDEDDGKHDDKDGDVCKDLEQGDPGVLELLRHCFASMVPLSKSVDCPLFFPFLNLCFHNSHSCIVFLIFLVISNLSPSGH